MSPKKFSAYFLFVGPGSRVYGGHTRRSLIRVCLAHQIRRPSSHYSPNTTPYRERLIQTPRVRRHHCHPLPFPLRKMNSRKLVRTRRYHARCIGVICENYCRRVTRQLTRWLSPECLLDYRRSRCSTSVVMDNGSRPGQTRLLAEDPRWRRVVVTCFRPAPSRRDTCQPIMREQRAEPSILYSNNPRGPS